MSELELRIIYEVYLDTFFSELLAAWRVVAVYKYNAKLMKQIFLQLISQVKRSELSQTISTVWVRTHEQVSL